MAESNATQVILTDDGLKIIKVKNTADNAASGITDLNDPNLMSVIEKQNNIVQFAGLTSQYNLIVQHARDDRIDTNDVTTAYNNLNRFMADILADPDHASDVDRVTYKKYQDAYNSALGKVQTDLSNSFNKDLSDAASAASAAHSTANAAKSAANSAYSKAQAIGNSADSSLAAQSTATAKAQSAADSAFSKAKTAIDDGKVTSQAVTNLKDGSTLTIAELGNGLAKKVANSDFASYKYQTASQISQLVTDGAFSAYSQATARLISSKVATEDFSSYKEQTARDIGSKVESEAFKTYKDQTDRAIEDKVSSADYKSDKKQTNQMISDKISENFNSLKISNRNLALETATAATMTGNGSINDSKPIYLLSNTIASGTTVTVSFDISIQNPIGNYTIGFIDGSWQKIADSPLTAGTQHQSYTFKTDADYSDGIQLRLDNSTSTVTVSNFIISESSKEVNWTPAPEDQATQSQFTQLKDNIDFRVTKKGLLDQINLQAGKTLISSSGQLTLSGKNISFDTDNPVIIPSANIDTLLVDKKLTAADISANTFKTNNETFTVYSNGAITAKNMTLIGGELTSPAINASTINGSTINGTTFHGGDIINNANNTARYYPMTITPDGAYKSTYFDNMAGMQSSVESGAITYKYRSMAGSGQYLAYDSVINGQGFESHSGYTSVKDSTFSNTETITGYVNVTPSSGIYLYGPTQKINFAGNSDNIGSNGITMDAYGNIYAQANSSFWRIRGINGNEIANFGIDTANQRNILLYRDTQVGNLFLGVGHTIGMLDSSPLYFKKGDSRGRMLGLYAGAIHYENLIKSSLLSVKQDVKKADTAYWAQLVNSIDLATYQYKTDDNTSHIRLSSIVDDVNDTKQWQLPDVFVSRDEDGKLCGVDDSVLLNATLATVQEQQKEIDQLNGHNMELEARLNKLEAKLNG